MIIIIITIVAPNPVLTVAENPFTAKREEHSIFARPLRPPKPEKLRSPLLRAAPLSCPTVIRLFPVRDLTIGKEATRELDYVQFKNESIKTQSKSAKTKRQIFFTQENNYAKIDPEKSDRIVSGHLFPK